MLNTRQCILNNISTKYDRYMNNTEKMLYRSTMDDTGRGHEIHDLYRADRRVQRCGEMGLFPENGRE